LSAASFQPKSTNRKLARTTTVRTGTGPLDTRFFPHAPFCSSTYTSIEATCSDGCPFKRQGDDRRGCFADAGFSRMTSKRLDRGALGLRALDVIRQEAQAIDLAFGGRRVPQDGARGGRDLRLHVGGDVGTTAGARLLAEAAKRWRARGGGTVWSYTHAWREVARAAWGPAISVLASIERPEDARAARRRGYAAAIVVPMFPEGARAFSYRGLKIVPCPAETGDATCIECRLCLDRDLLGLGVAIGFEVHGKDEKRAREQLVQLRRRPTQLEALA
jgi:hypothetical protein